jgi:hypothetical protein
VPQVIRIETSGKARPRVRLEVPCGKPVPASQKATLKRPDTETRLAASIPKPASPRILTAVPSPPRKTVPQTPAQHASKSISDSIKKLSGRAYDVYKDIFLSSVRGHIRSALLKNRSKPGGVFNDDTNKAENITYDFIERNYSNAYLDWASSEHRTRVLELGFELRNLDGIIEACYRKIEA